MQESRYSQLILSALRSDEIQAHLFGKTIRLIRFAPEAEYSLKEFNGIDKTEKHNKKSHAKMWSHLCYSISQSFPNTELRASCYEKRSDFYFHLKKYEACIHDVEKALEITESSELKVKLYCQKIMCLVALKKSVDDSLNEAKIELEKIKDSDEIKNLTLLVDKVQRVVNNYGGKDSVKIKNNVELLKMLNNKENEDLDESINIKYDNNNGRHLVVARDFKPGEIICVQTPYVSNSNTEFTPFAYCLHCLNVSWVSEPCSSDGWSFFCSQKCENEAREEYHDIECSVWPNIKEKVKCEFWRLLTVRTIIIALKEFGSIANLMAEVQEIDSYSDKCTKGFSENGQFETNRFRSLYSLTGKLSSKISDIDALDAAMLLVAFIKCSTIFGESNRFKTIQEVLRNEEVIFIGSLILKLFSIFSYNFQEIAEDSPRCEFNHDARLCWDKRCCYRATCVSPLFSLINHCCDPNAEIMMTDNGKLMLYALKPIKKNSQILYSYYGVGKFYNKDGCYRHTATEMIHGFSCNCTACKKNWPVLEQLKENVSSKKVSPATLKKINELIESVEQKKVRFDQNIAAELGKAIEAVSCENSQPSRVTCKLINALIKVYDKMYLRRVNMPKHCDKNP